MAAACSTHVQERSVHQHPGGLHFDSLVGSGWMQDSWLAAVKRYCSLIMQMRWEQTQRVRLRAQALMWRLRSRSVSSSDEWRFDRMQRGPHLMACQMRRAGELTFDRPANAEA